MAHLGVGLVRVRANVQLPRLPLTATVPANRARPLRHHARLLRPRNRERSAARKDQVRQRVVLDVLDAKEAVVREGEGRGAEEAEEVDGEDPDLVLVLALLQDVLGQSKGELEVPARACMGRHGMRALRRSRRSERALTGELIRRDPCLSRQERKVVCRLQFCRREILACPVIAAIVSPLPPPLKARPMNAYRAAAPQSTAPRTSAPLRVQHRQWPLASTAAAT